MHIQLVSMQLCVQAGSGRRTEAGLGLAYTVQVALSRGHPAEGKDETELGKKEADETLWAVRPRRLYFAIRMKKKSMFLVVSWLVEGVMVAEANSANKGPSGYIVLFTRSLWFGIFRNFTML